MNTLDKGAAPIPGGMEQDAVRFHHAAQNNAQVKTSELFISVYFDVMFSICGYLQVTKTTES